ncbi:MAG: hypothetical protein IJY28_02160 [Clostridia bacterium]|nr:hypothetical protein [Clostridia bacterium]
MQNDLHAARNGFLRGFLCTSVVLLLALGVLLGIHQAQVNTERICFGESGAAEEGLFDEIGRISGPLVKM